MDRVEAIYLLNNLRAFGKDDSDDEAIDLAIEALEGGTEEEVDYCNNCPYISWDNTDCISRADTIKAMCQECKVFPDDEVNCADCTDVAVIKGMPPVNQKQITGKLETAENATSEGKESTMDQPKSKLKNPCDSLLKADSDECKEQKSKLDCISRQQAIEALCEECMHGGYDTCTVDCTEVAVLHNLPPVTPTVSEDCISRQKAIETCDKMYPQVDRQDIKTVIEATPSVTPTERTGEWIKNDEVMFATSVFIT